MSFEGGLISRKVPINATSTDVQVISLTLSTIAGSVDTAFLFFVFWLLHKRRVVGLELIEASYPIASLAFVDQI